MVAGRHNLTRRALLGVGVGACAAGDMCGDMYSLRVPFGEAATGAADGASAKEEHAADGGHVQVHVPGDAHKWTRALAAYRRAEARVAAFKAEEARLPPERRDFHCDDLEERFGRLDSEFILSACLAGSRRASPPGVFPERLLAGSRRAASSPSPPPISPPSPSSLS